MEGEWRGRGGGGEGEVRGGGGERGMETSNIVTLDAGIGHAHLALARSAGLMGVPMRTVILRDQTGWLR